MGISQETAGLTPPEVAPHLLQAGVEEIAAAAELLVETPSDRALRRALHEAARGIELIIKSLLASVHWSQVFEDPSRASIDALARADFKSASVDACLERLKGLAQFDVSDHDRRRIAALRKKRNLLEHFGQMDGPDALRGAVGSALSTLIEIMEAAEDAGLLPSGGSDARTRLTRQLAEFDRFAETRMKAIAAKLDEQEAFECPACLKEASHIDCGLACLFCGTQSEPDSAADHYVENVLGVSRNQTVKDGGTWPVFGCSECGNESLVQVDTDGTEGRAFICFGCGEEWSGGALQPCSRCGTMVDADEMALCQECFSSEMARDN